MISAPHKTRVRADSWLWTGVGIPSDRTGVRSFGLAAAGPGEIRLPPAGPGQYGAGMC